LPLVGDGHGGDGGRAEPADALVASPPSLRALSPLPSQASLVSLGWQVSQALQAWQAPQVWRVRQV
jgi:hypothetical protein